MLIYAIISITSALAFYTIGVWGERIQRTLKQWHLALFWLGLTFDTIGTTLMGEIANGGFRLNFHGITGLLAIILMLCHAFWATLVLIENNGTQKANFHKFSIIVWLIWLIPFISGTIFGIAG